jgi:hypothetical protein
LNKKKTVETRVLADQLKGAKHKEERCAIEIRAPVGSEAHDSAKRLLKSLAIAGFKAELIDVVSTPHSGILIESATGCARTALSVQTAFKVAGMEAHLLIQNGSRPNTVIIHLGQSD